MYFNEKEDTNIDNEFKNNKKINLSKYKKYFIIGGIVISVLILIVLIAILLKNKTNYYITLEGLDEMTIYQGTSYNEPGYKAYDNKKNDLTQQVTVKNNLDTDTIGTYTIVYSLNNKRIIRTVNVVAKPDFATTIHLSGDKNIYLKVGDSFTDPGYTAIDAIDGDLTDKVTITGSVDTSKKGVYRVIYSVVNSSGVTASETRTIIVE